MKNYVIVQVKHGTYAGQVKLISNREYQDVMHKILSEADDLEAARADFERLNKIGVSAFVVEQFAKGLSKSSGS